jgi:hypothetical protein
MDPGVYASLVAWRLLEPLTLEAFMPLDARHALPGYRLVCTLVGVLYGVLGASMKLRGPRAAMAGFGVPPEVLDAPHFADFFQFLFLHMMVIGLLVGVLGWQVMGAARQRAVARVLGALELGYACFDLRTADWVLGSRLYTGPGSLVPPMLDLALALAFGWLGTRRLPPADPRVEWA